jgi:hypothetical protein
MEQVQFIDDRAPIEYCQNLIDEMSITNNHDNASIANYRFNHIGQLNSMCIEENIAPNLTSTNINAPEDHPQEVISLETFCNKFICDKPDDPFAPWRHHIAKLEAIGFKPGQIADYLNLNGVNATASAISWYLRKKDTTRIFVNCAIETEGEKSDFICRSGYLDKAIKEAVRKMADGEKCTVTIERDYLTNQEWENLLALSKNSSHL